MFAGSAPDNLRRPMSVLDDVIEGLPALSA
jgi:hypothetical protein